MNKGFADTIQKTLGSPLQQALHAGDAAPSSKSSAGKEMAEQVLQAFKQNLERNIKPLLTQIANLEARLAEIETKGISYKGVWQASGDYKRGDLATHGGSMWHANTATRNPPGDGSKDWTLAVKRGDGGRH